MYIFLYILYNSDTINQSTNFIDFVKFPGVSFGPTSMKPSWQCGTQQKKELSKSVY